MLATLTQIPLFADFNTSDFKCLRSCLNTQLVEFSRGDVVASTLLPTESLGIVISGALLETRYLYCGTETIVDVLEPGMVFGEGVFANTLEAQSVAVLGASNGTILRLDSRQLANPNSSCPIKSVVLQNLLLELSNKSVRMRQKFDILAHKSLRGRVLLYLQQRAQLSGQSQFTIPLTRTELAAYLCVDRAALAREITRLQEEGRIRTSRNFFEILAFSQVDGQIFVDLP